MRILVTRLVLGVAGICQTAVSEVNTSHPCAAFAEGNLIVNESPEKIHVRNDDVAVDIQKNVKPVVLSFLAKDSKGEWQKVCESFTPDFTKHPKGNRFFDTSITPHRFQVNELSSRARIKSKSADKVVVSITGTGKGAKTEYLLSLGKDDSFFHHDIMADLNEPSLDYIMSSFAFNLDGEPEFIHSPSGKEDTRSKADGGTMKPTNPSKPNKGKRGTKGRIYSEHDQVIGDHAFHAPAVILQEGPLFAALVPDLHAINEHHVLSPDARRQMLVRRNPRFASPFEDDKLSMPTALDLNVQSGLTKRPVFSYGMMDFMNAPHIRYCRVNDGSMVRKLNGKRVRYAFDLFLGANEPANLGFQKIARHQWETYGTKQFHNKRHLAMPFDEYVKTIYGVVSKPMDPQIQAPVSGFADNGVFLDFTMNGRPVGGMVAPLVKQGFGDALWNFEFWNNVRDASGMYYWGKKLNNPTLMERGQRVINLALESHRNKDGFFNLIYHAKSKKWTRSSLGPSPNLYTIFDRSSNPAYNVPAMSKTAAHMLEFYNRCEKNPRIVSYLTAYADGVLKHIDREGCIPSYYTPDMKPIEALTRSAQPVATMWFLAEMYNATKAAKYREGAEKIAGYMMREILPHQRWIDLEPYYSCGKNSTDYLKDRAQGLPIRGTLSTYWAARGFAALYRATADKRYLLAGETAIDYVSFSQACWDPHYVYTAMPFGGFTVDNLDTATWLDARQCEMVGPYIWYGQMLGRRDLLERGVAAARSSVVLINHPLHKSNDIYRHTNLYGFGLGPENINHMGYNQSCMRTHPGWGECSGIFTGLADADRMLGGAYIDLESNLAVGVDGVTTPEFTLTGDRLVINIKSRLVRLKQPWTKSYDIALTITGCKSDHTYTVVVNDSKPITFNNTTRISIGLRVRPDGSIITGGTE